MRNPTRNAVYIFYTASISPQNTCLYIITEGTPFIPVMVPLMQQAIQLAATAAAAFGCKWKVR